MLIIEVRFLNDHSHCNFALIQVAIYTFQRIYAIVPRMDCDDTARLWGSLKEIGETPFFYNHHFYVPLDFSNSLINCSNIEFISLNF